MQDPTMQIGSDEANRTTQMSMFMRVSEPGRNLADPNSRYKPWNELDILGIRRDLSDPDSRFYDPTHESNMAFKDKHHPQENPYPFADYPPILPFSGNINSLLEREQLVSPNDAIDKNLAVETGSSDSPTHNVLDEYLQGPGDSPTSIYGPTPNIEGEPFLRPSRAEKRPVISEGFDYNPFRAEIEEDDDDNLKSSKPLQYDNDCSLCREGIAWPDHWCTTPTAFELATTPPEYKVDLIDPAERMKQALPPLGIYAPGKNLIPGKKYVDFSGRDYIAPRAPEAAVLSATSKLGGIHASNLNLSAKEIMNRHDPQTHTTPVNRIGKDTTPTRYSSGSSRYAASRLPPTPLKDKPEVFAQIEKPDKFPTSEWDISHPNAERGDLFARYIGNEGAGDDYGTFNPPQSYSDKPPTRIPTGPFKQGSEPALYSTQPPQSLTGKLAAEIITRHHGALPHGHPGKLVSPHSPAFSEVLSDAPSTPAMPDFKPPKKQIFGENGYLGRTPAPMELPDERYRKQPEGMFSKIKSRVGEIVSLTHTAPSLIDWLTFE
jgi:hypothetical protein